MFPVLLYGLECCHLNKADLQSLDLTSNRLFMKLFRTGSIDVVQECRSYFGVELPSCITVSYTHLTLPTILRV